MDQSLINMCNNELYVTHAEFQECFIKIWAFFYTNQTNKTVNYVQNYNNYTKEITKLDLYGNTMYVYICKTGFDIQLYRCQVLLSNLETKKHTILLIDYGMKIVASYFEVQEVTTDNINKLYSNNFSQRSPIHTFILSRYISKSKSTSELINILCNKHYKYHNDFNVGDIKFVTLYGIDKRLTDSGVADIISIATMNIIANNLSSTITLNFKNDIVKSCPIPSNASMMYSFLKSQHLVYNIVISVNVTRVCMDTNSILLTVQTVNKEIETLNVILNSIDRHNLKLTSVLEVYTPCLIVFHNKLVRAIILDVQIDSLFIDLVDYGVRHVVPRTSVFEIPPNCYLTEMQSLNVLLDKPNHVTVDKSILVKKYFHMLPLKIDPSFGLYKVKLFKKINEEFIDIFDLLNNIDTSTNEQCSIPENSSKFISITEINEMKSIENTVNINYATPLNHLYSNKMEKENIDLKEKEISNYSNQTEKQNVDPKEKQISNHATPILFLTKENLKDSQEIIGSLIYYKSPFNFQVRKYNSNFEPFMNQIKSNVDSRYILKKCDIIQNMYVIYQSDDSIYRGQVIDMDSEIKKIKLQLVDEGEKIIDVIFDKIILYNFIESDCHLPGQLVLDCSLNNIWFPIMNVDTILMLKPYFNQELLYKVRIIKTDMSGVKLVQMIKNDTNIDILDTILQSGIGQHLCAAIKTDETPYEVNLFIGQTFLSYIYCHHFKLCIQPEPNTVDELEEEILEHVKGNYNPDSLDLKNLQGTYCLTTMNNNQWYRAFITNISEESIIVNLFDIGLLTDVTLKQIRPITKNLMKKPQLCLNCNFENKDVNIKITEKTLYNVAVKSINTNGELLVTIKEHHDAPLSNPIVRSIEQISFVHVDGDLTYLQRSQDKLKIEKMSNNLSKLVGKLESKSSVVPGEVNVFASCGKYYRCVIKSISHKTATVHCIDFGFEKKIPTKKLQHLKNSKVSMLPALVTIVKTFPMTSTMSDKMFLANMYIGDDGTFNVSLNDTNLIQPENKLMESLVNGCLVKITCVYSSDDCWIVPHMFLDKLNIISEILVKMQSNITPAVMEIGSLCAALHSETKTWHRALILDGGAENILAIDSGERFKALKTSKLVSEIQNIPNCAIHCQVVSNVDVKKLLNKTVECKLISYTKPLLEVELFSTKMDNTETTPTESNIEWLVTIIKFESFKEFYVKKINDNYCSEDSSNDYIQSRIYRCYLEEEIDDYNLNNPTNLDIILDTIMTFEWTLKTSSDREPYKVTLMIDGLNCIEILYRILSTDVCEVSENSVSLKNKSKTIETCVGPNVTKMLMDNQNDSISKKTNIENNIVLFNIETVTIKFIDSFKYFYVYSESLSTLYMQKINNELDVCIVKFPINQNMIGSIVITSSQVSKCWCRAKIDNVLTDQTGAYCYLMDLGHYEVCTEFYKPTDFLLVCPPIVRRCMLYAPQFDGKENEIWYPDIDMMFRDILTIDGLKFYMTIKENGDPCVITLQLEANNMDLSDILSPVYVKVTHIHSLTDFKIRILCPKQKALIELLEGGNDIPMELIKNPIIGNLYVVKIKSKFKRVKYEALCGIKYVVIDIDDTLDVLSVDSLYEIPEKIRNCPPFTITCSFILKDKEETYSLSIFKRLANTKLTFIMCVITESDGIAPNLIKLYYNNKNVLDIIKSKIENQ